jgi:hypothetical protein
MASSFDSVEQGDWQQVPIEEVDYFLIITDMYAQYRDNNPQIRGMAIKHGQVEELPLDLCISVECALKALTPRERTLFQCFSAHGVEAVNKCLPASIRRKLQEPFKHIYYGFLKLVAQGFHARGVQQRRDAREAQRIAERQAAAATYILENTDPVNISEQLFTEAE